MQEQPSWQMIARQNTGDTAVWLDSLTHVTQLLQLTRDRPPESADGTDLYRDELRRALIVSRFPDQAPVVWDAIARGSGAAAAAVLSQLHWHKNDEGGIVILTEPQQSPRSIPVGNAGMSWSDWTRALALALIARDQNAINILCTPTSINACALPASVMDSFWGCYSHALAALVVEPATTATWVRDTEIAIANAQITAPDVIADQVRPILQLITSLQEGAEVFNARLQAAITAHRHYYNQPEREYDWQGIFALEATALAALAHDRGVPITVTSADLPIALVQGTFAPQFSTVTYRYPRRRIATASEAHWFLDLEGFPRVDRRHQLLSCDHELIARYEAAAAPGIPPAIADFLLVENGSAFAYPAPDQPPPALDAGQLLFLAQAFASATRPGDDLEAWQEQRMLLDDAIACVDAVLSRIPTDQEAIVAATLTSPAGQHIYQTEPGRFRRDRLTAYRNALQQQLQQIDAALSTQLHPGEAMELELDVEPDPKAVALTAMSVIQAQVMPLLTAIAQDSTGNVVAQLQPQDEDFAKVFNGAAIGMTQRAYADLWSRGVQLYNQIPRPFEIRCHVAPAGLLTEENELSRHFPQGYRAIAQWLNPQRIWIAWIYARSGEQSGLALDGLVWIDDHWSWFPKPYRVLRDLC